MGQNPAEIREQQLWETVQRLHAIVESSPLAIIALDADGYVRMWNRGAERIFGWTEEEVIGRSNPTIPADRHGEYEALVKSRMQGEAQAGFETVRLRKDGTRVDVSIWTSPLRDGSGNITGIMTELADITERKRSEGERAELVVSERAARAEAGIEKRYRKLLEAAPDAPLLHQKFL